MAHHEKERGVNYLERIRIAILSVMSSAALVSWMALGISLSGWMFFGWAVLTALVVAYGSTYLVGAFGGASE